MDALVDDLPAEIGVALDLLLDLRLADLAADGTFIARLAPGDYRLQLPDDSRSVPVSVPAGHCVDLVLDFRLPSIVLQIPGEGLPIPRPTL